MKFFHGKTKSVLFSGLLTLAAFVSVVGVIPGTYLLGAVLSHFLFILPSVADEQIKQSLFEIHIQTFTVLMPAYTFFLLLGCGVLKVIQRKYRLAVAFFTASIFTHITSFVVFIWFMGRDYFENFVWYDFSIPTMTLVCILALIVILNSYQKEQSLS